MQLSRSIFFGIILCLMGTSAAWAFPEVVRRGYGNCITCHYSPTGSGILNAYGRELSGEVLSQFSREGEGRFAYDLVHLPEWLALGGDLRVIQTYQDTNTVTSGRLFVMQSDLEAAMTYKSLTAVGTLGINEPDNSVISRRHYLLARFNDQVTARVGRFMKAFGINTAEHTLSTKRDLGWDFGTETYNLEGAYIGDTLNLFATAVLGRPDDVTLKREKGAAFSGSLFFADRFKAGASYFYGKNELQNRHVFGPFAILGFTPSFFLLSELDFQLLKPVSAAGNSGLVDYQRLDYEFFQGFHAFLTQEHTRLDFSRATAQKDAYGIGVQYFPRPHFEIQASWQKVKVGGGQNDFADFAWILFHFYP